MAKKKAASGSAKPASRRKAKPQAASDSPPDADTIVAHLRDRGSNKIRDGMARFAIPSDKAFGWSVGDLRTYAKKLGPSHALAADLWASGWYEARLLAAFVDDPAEVTSTQMDRWSLDFDNWAVCDTACFHLFDRASDRWSRLAPWAKRRDEFPKRAAFALLWGMSVHDKQADEAKFLDGLDLLERSAEDERNFVKKAVNMALRAIGKRSPALHSAAVAVSQRLAERKDATARWVGKDALRELKSASVARRLAKSKR